MISEVCKTIFGISKDDPLGKGVFDKVPAITRDLLLAVKIVVSELSEIATVASEKLFAICYPPKAIAKATGSAVTSIVTVSVELAVVLIPLPPAIVSVLPFVIV